MHFAYFQLRVAKQYQIQNVSQLFIETYFCDVDTVCTLASVWLWNFFDGGSKKARVFVKTQRTQMSRINHIFLIFFSIKKNIV